MEMIDSMMHVLAYDDHADGNTYLAEEHLVELGYTFTVALDLLTRHDNILIVDSEAYDDNKHDYFALAPYSITMGAGVYAKPVKGDLKIEYEKIPDNV